MDVYGPITHLSWRDALRQCVLVRKDTWSEWMSNAWLEGGGLTVKESDRWDTCRSSQVDRDLIGWMVWSGLGLHGEKDVSCATIWEGWEKVESPNEYVNSWMLTRPCLMGRGSFWRLSIGRGLGGILWCGLYILKYTQQLNTRHGYLTNELVTGQSIFSPGRADHSSLFTKYTSRLYRRQQQSLMNPNVFTEIMHDSSLENQCST